MTGLDQNDTGVVLTLADGRQVRAAYAVAADGASSTVRRLLDIAFLGTTDEETRMLVADVEVDWLDRDHWHVWGDCPDLRTTALAPLPATTRWQLQVGRGDPNRIADQEEIRTIIEDLGPRVRLRDVAWCSTWRLNVRMVDRYRVGRVFLAGDAAHVHSPAGALGMNTGIQDAVNLSWKLAAAIADPATGDALLDTYETERLPVAAGVVGLSDRLLAAPFFARDGSESQDVLQLDLTYRGGPLAPVTDPHEPGPRPGDRAPDSPLSPPGPPTSRRPDAGCENTWARRRTIEDTSRPRRGRRSSVRAGGRRLRR